MLAMATTADKLARDMIADFSANIRAHRLELGLSQVELASRIGASFQYVSEMERGTRVPLFRNIAKFAAALRCTPAALFDPRRKISKTA